VLVDVCSKCAGLSLSPPSCGEGLGVGVVECEAVLE
jgi:hypothetical protein